MENDKEAIRKKVEILLNSEYLTAPTRQVLLERLEKTGAPKFFDQETFHLLNSICDLLLDQDTDDRMVNIALFIDERLSEKRSNGWRYDRQPPDPIAYVLGLKAIDKEAKQRFGKEFYLLNKEQQIQILTDVQKGNIKSDGWEKVDPKLFFEDLLAESTEIFFSHPKAQLSIDYLGMADGEGWSRIKLNQSEKLERL